MKTRIAVPNDGREINWRMFAAFLAGLAMGFYVAMFVVTQ